MPSRSSHSVRHDAVPKGVVVAAARQWAEDLRRERPEVVRVGYFGSYAQDRYVPGSDLDVLIELSHSDKGRWVDRVVDYRPSGLPVPVDIFPYTTPELAEMHRNRFEFLQTILNQIVWLTS